MHVGLFVTASQEHTVRPSKSFGAETGGERDGGPAPRPPPGLETNNPQEKAPP